MAEREICRCRIKVSVECLPVTPPHAEVVQLHAIFRGNHRTCTFREHSHGDTVRFYRAPSREIAGRPSASYGPARDGYSVLPANAFSKTSAIFYGWNTAANGSGTSYADQSQITVPADVLLYAQYIDYDPSFVSISFNPNGPRRGTRQGSDATRASLF
ncbi:MAG: hypothetical protein F2808_01105 [Actinobacteria bacterium]|nr:hypothetical protein [Actinomycetota bacterium]